jgi:hypothetical protein
MSCGIYGWHSGNEEDFLRILRFASSVLIPLTTARSSSTQQSQHWQHSQKTYSTNVCSLLLSLDAIHVWRREVLEGVVEENARSFIGRMHCTRLINPSTSMCPFWSRTVNHFIELDERTHYSMSCPCVLRHDDVWKSYVESQVFLTAVLVGCEWLVLRSGQFVLIN